MVQFAIIFHILREGKLMTNYENFTDFFFQWLKVEITQNKLWSSYNVCKVEKSYNSQVLQATKEVGIFTIY